MRKFSSDKQGTFVLSILRIFLFVFINNERNNKINISRKNYSSREITWKIKYYHLYPLMNSSRINVFFLYLFLFFGCWVSF